MTSLSRGRKHKRRNRGLCFARVARLCMVLNIVVDCYCSKPHRAASLHEIATRFRWEPAGRAVRQSRPSKSQVAIERLERLFVPVPIEIIELGLAVVIQ